MCSVRLNIALLSCLFGGLAGDAVASDKGPFGIRDPEHFPRYTDVIQRVVAMPSDGDLQSRASQHKLDVLNVMWEDTGRDLGSAYGPNISDLTLQVREAVGDGWRTHLLPVIRNPNFEDKTADMRADKLWVRVGNHRKGGELVAVPLTEVLANLKEYLGDPKSMKGSGNLLAKRDTHFLVSAQHVFLPIPKSGKAEFNPVLYNYQSEPGNPGVLTLLITREGMSATVIENRAGEQTQQQWGQQLFFNNAGQKTAFTAERKSDVASRIKQQGTSRPGDAGALEEGADMMLLVQVPLKQRVVRRQYNDYDMEDGIGMSAPAASAKGGARGRSDVEEAVLGHGEDLGTFIEMNALEIARDERFPVRVTVQFYKATSNGVVSEADLTEVANTIAKVYKSADYVGSLVVPESERVRPTDWNRKLPQVQARSTRDSGGWASPSLTPQGLYRPTFHHDRYGRHFR